MPKKKKSTGKSRQTLLLLLVFLGIASAVGIYLTVRLNSVVPEIFLIDNTLTYGETSLEGTLIQGLADDGSLSYLLLLDSGQPIQLDIRDLDHYLGSRLLISGTLYPSPDDLIPPELIISSLELVN